MLALALLTIGGSGAALADQPAGLVAAYSFDEGAGAVANDSSGNGHDGAITGGAWTSGRNGSGLELDGTDDHVALGSLGTFYDSGFTLEAWVKKQGTKNDVTVLGTWTSGGAAGP